MSRNYSQILLTYMYKFVILQILNLLGGSRYKIIYINKNQLVSFNKCRKNQEDANPFSHVGNI